MKKTYSNILHPFAPLYNSDSRVLILGSFPSEKSRKENFYYANPQNRFWRVMFAVFDEKYNDSTGAKSELLLKRGIALWDSIFECDITGSSDSSIKNAVPADISKIIKNSKIKTVFTNGKASFRVYEKYQRKLTGIPAISLPSTSPANAAWSFGDLLCEYSAIKDYL